MIKKSDLLKEIVQIRKELHEIEKNYALLLEKRSPSTSEYADRVADLEVKMAKLWSILLKIDMRGNDQPTTTARRLFGGQSKHLLTRNNQ